MKHPKQLLTLFVFLSVLATSHLSAADGEQKLFVNLTSDDMKRAAMAIGFSSKILAKKKIPVTLFLNVDAVRIADKRIPGSTYVTGKSLQAMPIEFMKLGGRVIICPMCLQTVGGIAKDDLLEGVEIGGPDVTWPLLFAKGTTVLSY